MLNWQMHEMPADPGHSYITARISVSLREPCSALCCWRVDSKFHCPEVSLRPLERPGSVVSPLPIFFRLQR